MSVCWAFLLAAWYFSFQNCSSPFFSWANSSEELGYLLGQRCSACHAPEIFLTSKFSYLLFPTPPIELKPRLRVLDRSSRLGFDWTCWRSWVGSSESMSR
jgi:hypothetical protein